MTSVIMGERRHGEEGPKQRQRREPRNARSPRELEGASKLVP